MSLLEEVCASRTDRAVVDSLELRSTAWPPIRLVQGFQDLRLGFGDGESRLFTAAPMGLVLPDRSEGVSQRITFALENVTGQTQRAVDDAISGGHDVIIIFRRYIEGEYYGPSERPFIATVRGGSIDGYRVTLEGGFNNILDYGFPRGKYDLSYCPDLAYQ